MNALEFLIETEAEYGVGWHNDAGLLIHKFEEYATIKAKESTREKEQEKTTDRQEKKYAS